MNHERNKDPGTLTNQDCPIGNPAGHGGEVVDLETSSLETREGRGNFDGWLFGWFPGGDFVLENLGYELFVLGFFRFVSF